MKQSPFKAFLPIVIIFAAVTLFALVGADVLERLNIDRTILLGGNSLLFLVTAGSFLFFRKALQAQNTHAFLRNVYSAILLKFFILVFVAFVWIYLSGGAVNKGAMLSMVVLYFVYMFSEVALLMNMSRQIRENKNA